MKKKVLGGVLAVIVLLAGVWFVGTGFIECGSVNMGNFTVSENGNTLAFHAGVTTSMGYIRGFCAERVDNVQYLTFYNTFGGLNSRFGAKTEFTLPLEGNDNAVYFDMLNGENRLVLEKDKLTGEWTKP